MIVLINPYQAQLVSRVGKIYNRVWPPLSLANCAALLERQGQKVRIIDANALRMPPVRLQAELKDCERVFVSSSDLDRWQCPGIPACRIQGSWLGGPRPILRLLLPDPEFP